MDHLEPLKPLLELKEQLLTLLNYQIASRNYMLGELVGSLYPSILRDELEKLEALKAEVLKLGESQ